MFEDTDDDRDDLRAAAVGLRRLAQLDTAIGELHTPVEEEAEVWADFNTSGQLHAERFPDCSPASCEGHVVEMLVCSECGYTHDGETPIFRQWPCPTLAAVAEGAEDRGQTHTQGGGSDG